MKNRKTTTTLLVSVALMIGATAAMTTLAPVNIVEQAYAVQRNTATFGDDTADQRVIETESAEQSSIAAHRGTMEIEVQGEPDDEPAHRGEISLKLPNDTIKERVIESAPQSSNAAAAGQGGQDILTFGFGDVDP